MTDISAFGDLIPLDHGLCVLSTWRVDAGIQSSVVNAGVIQHPRTATPVAATVALGGTHDDWDTYDGVMRAERRTAVLITPVRVYTNRGRVARGATEAAHAATYLLHEPEFDAQRPVSALRATVTSEQGAPVGAGGAPHQGVIDRAADDVQAGESLAKVAGFGRAEPTARRESLGQHGGRLARGQPQRQR